jgi:hypothetical protein
MSAAPVKNQGVAIINKKATYIPKPDAEGGAGEVYTNIHEGINMYTEPPTNIISLHEFSKIALDRLQVLKKIEFM